MAIRTIPQPVAAWRLLVRADVSAARLLVLEPSSTPKVPSTPRSEHAFPDVRGLDGRALASGSFLAPALDAAVAYIAGTAVLLFGLGLEIGGWVSRNVIP